MLTKAQQETIRTLAATLARAPHGGRRGLVAACADQLGVSIPTVYRALKDVAGGAPRKKRSDAGKRSVDRALALQVAGLVHTARRANGKQTMSLGSAVEILAANGQGAVNRDTGEVVMPSVSTSGSARFSSDSTPAIRPNGAVTSSIIA